MGTLLDALLGLDRILLETSAALRWDVLTPLFVIASAWWVKTLVFAGVGAVTDLARLRRFPSCAICVLAAVGVASALVTLIKEAVDRARPAAADPALTALVPTPDNPSFPSGHTATAFAGAVVLAMFHPKLRLPALALACAVGFSRVYLGVHFLADVVAGAALGVLIGLAVAWLGRRVETMLRQPRIA
jgi:membrane-associated phospholipid phosphatase